MLRKDFLDVSDNGQVGDWCFINDDTYIVIKFSDDPDNGICVLPIKDAPNHPTNRWDWDGNREAPTLTGHNGTDSIKVWNGKSGAEYVEYGHFFMKAGKLVQA
jgi:hypothetical protein